MSETITKNLTLHEAMILALLERKLEVGVAEMGNSELEAVIRKRNSYRQENGDHPDSQGASMP